MSREGKKFAIYDGSTSCYLLRADNEKIYLDSGSGIAGAKPEIGTNITILLTHMHIIISMSLIICDIDFFKEV